MSASSKFKLTAEMLADEVDPRPSNLFNWGVAKHYGSLTKRSREFVRLNLLPSAKATVTAEGIYFERMYYVCSSEWRTRARNLRSWRIDVVYDPRLVDRIFIREGGQLIETCHLTNAFYEVLHGLDFRETREYFDQNKAFEQANQTRSNQSKAKLHAQQKQVFDEARKQNQEAIESQERSSNSALLRELRPHREVERTHERKSGVEEWQGKSTSDLETQTFFSQSEQKNKNEAYIAPAQEHDMLDELLGDFFKDEA